MRRAPFSLTGGHVKDKDKNRDPESMIGPCCGPLWASDPLLCAGCGGTNLQVAMWVNAGSGEVDEPVFDLYLDPDQSSFTATWCEDCTEDHGSLLASQAMRRALLVLGALSA